MNKQEQTEINSNIEKLLGNFLKYRSAANVPNKDFNHLNEDSLTAFVEGNLSEKESVPLVKHLIECLFCRRVTAELFKLNFAFTEETIFASASEPTRISEVLNNLLARIFGTSDGAVFAHQEPENKDTDEEKTKEKS